MDSRNEAALTEFATVIVERDQQSPPSLPVLRHRLSACSAILSLNGFGAGDITRELVNDLPALRVICIAHPWGQFGDLQRVRVIEGSDAVTRAVTEWVVSAALMGVRQLHLFDGRLKRGSPWGEPRREVGMLSESTVGLIGLGRTGRRVARMFRAFGAIVIGYSRSCSAELAASLEITLVPLEELMRTADVISLHHQVAPDTRGIIGARELGWIKPGCVFINAARAALCDEGALVAELKTGRFTAYLDVFEVEPLPLAHPFRSMPNVVLTPHIAGNNSVMFRKCAREAIETLRNALEETSDR
jgi:phosphoglycerate dehydrogenase-like enzyme